MKIVNLKTFLSLPTFFCSIGLGGQMTRITDERLAELADMSQNVADVLVSRNLQVGAYPDIAAALRELQQLRTCHREVICRRCGLRDQLGEVPNADF